MNKEAGAYFEDAGVVFVLWLVFGSTLVKSVCVYKLMYVLEGFVAIKARVDARGQKRPTIKHSVA